MPVKGVATIHFKDTEEKITVESSSVAAMLVIDDLKQQLDKEFEFVFNEWESIDIKITRI